MSHSQFHSIKLFTLRHAWLNLWDKHMTTGRINQITIVQRSPETQRDDVVLTQHIPYIPKQTCRENKRVVPRCWFDEIIICDWYESMRLNSSSCWGFARQRNSVPEMLLSRHAPAKAKVCHVLVGFSLRGAIWTAARIPVVLKHRKEL